MDKIQKVTITRLVKSDKKKDGTEYKTSQGKKFYRVAILTNLEPTVWRSTSVFNSSDPIFSFKEGQEVTLRLYDTGEWKNFALPDKADLLTQRVVELEKVVGDLVRTVNGQATDEAKGYHYPTAKEEDIKPEDIPF